MTPANDPFWKLRFLEPHNQNVIPEYHYEPHLFQVGMYIDVISLPVLVWVATKLDLSSNQLDGLICTFVAPFTAESAEEAAARYPGYDVQPFLGPRAAWQYLTRWDYYSEKQLALRVGQILDSEAA